MRKRVTMKHLVRQQTTLAQVVPTFKLEFNRNDVRATTQNKILSPWLRLREMNAWIEGFWESWSVFRMGEK